MNIYTIIEVGEGLTDAALQATNRANEWLDEHAASIMVKAINAQTVLSSDSLFCVHIITISYQLPTARNLAAAIAGLV